MNSEFSAEVYHTLVNGGLFIAVIVQLTICLRRVVAGYRSTYPVNWTHAKLLVLRSSRIAISLLTAAAWVTTISSVQRVASPLSHGIIVDEVGLPLFGALASTLGWLWVVTPKAWSNRAMCENFTGFAVLLFIVVFMEYAPPRRF
jgi:hypothetical protein